jgi:hypothetical protein
MPYITYQNGNYTRLDKPANIYDFGVNWFIKGNTSKFTLDYQLRSTYTTVGTDLIQDASMKGQVVLQYQIFI